MSKTFTKKDVAEHKTEDQGIWIIVDDGVYDITSTSSPMTLPVGATGAPTVARRLGRGKVSHSTGY